jgi:hypothetical protein
MKHAPRKGTRRARIRPNAQAVKRAGGGLAPPSLSLLTLRLLCSAFRGCLMDHAVSVELFTRWD